MVVYSVGSYAIFDEAINRQTQLELNERMDDTEIVEVEDGVVTPYSPVLPVLAVPKKEEVAEEEAEE